MPYSITTKDGITINNIPDNVDPQSDELKKRVADLRSGASNPQPVAEEKEKFVYSAADAMAGLAPNASSRTKLQEMNGQITPEQADEQRRTANQVSQSFAQGAVFGLTDEAQAATLALVGTALPESMGGLPDGKSLSENYKGLRDEIRGRNNEFAEKNPEIDGALKLTGGGLTGVAGGGKSIAGLTGKELLKRGALTGAGFGAVQSLGDSEANLVGENKDFVGAISDTGKGALIGASAGAIISGGVMGAQRLLSNVAKNAGVKKLLSNKNLPAKLTDESDAKKVFEAIDDTADKVLLNGATKTHKQARAAIDAGFKKGDVFAIRTSSDATKKQGFKMISDYQRILNDSRYGQTRQVTDAVGEAALKRVKVLRDMNKSAGQQVDKAAKGLQGVKVDVSREVDDFLSQLDSIGVDVNVSPSGLKINYAGSEFEGEGMKKAQNIINNIVKRMANTKEPNAYDVHRMKRYIDNQVTFGGGKSGAEGRAEGIIKNLRRNLDGYLDNLSPTYDRANQKYSDTIGVLNEIDSLVGKNGVSSRTLGLIANRSDSRAVSSGRVSDVYADLDAVAEKYGVKFKDSVSDLKIIANAIDNTLPNTINNSLQGQTTNAIEKANQMRGRTMTDGLFEVAGSAVERFKGDPTARQINALKELLKSNTAFQQ